MRDGMISENGEWHGIVRNESALLKGSRLIENFVSIGVESFGINLRHQFRLKTNES